jgi:tetratricopeptide (TPR) repeat protein
MIMQRPNIKSFCTTLCVLAFLAVELRSQETAPPEKTEAPAKNKPSESSAIDDLDNAMDLKMEAKNIEQRSKVVTLLESAIKKGLSKDDQDLAKELLAATFLERAKLQLQELQGMSKNRINEGLLRRVQKGVLEDLEQATKNDPRLGEAHLLIAKLSAGTDPSRARKALDDAIKYLERDREKLGEAYAIRSLLQEKADDKIADLRKALKNVPESVEVQSTLFELLSKQNKFEEVYEVGVELLNNNAKNPVALQATVAALLVLERSDDALKMLNHRIENEPDDFSLLLLRGNVYLDKSSDAAPTKKNLTPKTDNETDTASTESVDDKESEKQKSAYVEAAIADGTKLIELNGTAIEGYFLRAKAYVQRASRVKEGNDSESLRLARRDIDAALDIRPNSVEGIRLRAAVASQQKRYDEAIQDTTMLAKNFPDNEVWLEHLATLYQLDNRPSLAVKVADQLITKDKKNWRAFRIRGDAKLSTGDQQSAVEDYKKALNLMKNADEDRSSLLNNLAWLFATSTDDSLRNGKEAIELGKEACELTDFKAAHILSTLAAAYAETGDFEEAIKWSTKAVELGATEDHEQLEQLKNELKSYQEKKPWREKQEVKEKKPPVIKSEDAIET